MNLTAQNTAVVIDSTADFPDAEARFPNFRVVPLYVRFGEESFRDYVDMSPSAFYERLASAKETPTTSQPTPADFHAVYAELAPQYERILSIQLSSTLSGTFASAEAAAELLGRRDRARDRLGHRLGGARDARARRAAPPRARDDRRGDRRARRPLPGRPPPALHGEHARVPGAGRPHRPRGRAGREPAEREADPHDPRRRGRAAEARARQREGVRGVPRRCSRRRRPTRRA